MQRRFVTTLPALLLVILSVSFSHGSVVLCLLCLCFSVWKSHFSSPGGLSYSSLKGDPVPSTFHVGLMQSQDYSVNDLLRNISESRSLNIPQIMRAGELKPSEPLQLPMLPLAMMKSAQTSSLPPQEEMPKIEFPKRKGNGVVLIHRDYLDTDEPAQQSAWSVVPVVTVVDGKVDGVVQMKVVDDGRSSEAQSEREVEVVDREEEKEKEEKTKEMETQSERPTKATDDVSRHQKPPEKTPKAKKGRKRKAVNPKDNIVVVETHISDDNVQPVAPSLEPVSPIPAHAEGEYVDVSAQMIDNLNAGRFEPATVNKNVFVTYVQ